MTDLTLDDVTITLTAEQDDLPVRGNAAASGDDALDAEAEREILDRLDHGDVWAWASVRVRATWTAPSGTEYHGETYLGGCSYRDEADFREGGGYYDQMVDEAMEDLHAVLRAWRDAAGATRTPTWRGSTGTSPTTTRPKAWTTEATAGSGCPATVVAAATLAGGADDPERLRAAARDARIEEASRALHSAHLAVADAAGAWYDTDRHDVESRDALIAAVEAWRAAGEAFVRSLRGGAS